MGRKPPLMMPMPVVGSGQVLPFTNDRSRYINLVQLRAQVFANQFPLQAVS
jgi:hypothetical protein